MQRYRHKKRGTVYEVITSNASMQCSAAPEFEKAFEDDAWTVYRSVKTHAIWIRPTEEFQDGRFDRLPDDDDN